MAHTTEEEARHLAEELRTLVEQQNFNIGRSVTISGGVSSAKDHDTATSWIERCDNALYKAKASGRNAVFISYV